MDENMATIVFCSSHPEVVSVSLLSESGCPGYWLWPTEWGRNEALWFSRLDLKRSATSAHFFPSGCQLLCRSPSTLNPPYCEEAQASWRERERGQVVEHWSASERKWRECEWRLFRLSRPALPPLKSAEWMTPVSMRSQRICRQVPPKFLTHRFMSKMVVILSH